MKIFVACLGTIGDLNPYLTVGAELSARGHDVTVLSDASKEESVARAGLRFAKVMPRGSWERVVSQPAFWARETCLQTVLQYVYIPTAVPIYKYVLANHEPDNTLLVGLHGSIGLRFAQEKLGAPLVHLYLSPYQARREENATDTQEDSQLSSLLKQLRSLFKLPAQSQPLQDWLFSADRRIAAFPRWFDAAEVDTLDLACTDFVFSDDVRWNDATALNEFLANGSPPIVFTAGTGARHARGFFQAALPACERLSARAIFLSSSAEQLPPHLPETVFHCTYAPLARLLPAVEGIVHHGGIGTCAQALRAGIYQLIRPTAFDQFDNAQRIAALGVGASICSSVDDGSEMAAAIARLRSNPAVKQRCSDVSRCLTDTDATSAIATLIETAM